MVLSKSRKKVTIGLLAAVAALGIALSGCGGTSSAPAKSSAPAQATGKPLDTKAYDKLVNSGEVASGSTVNANKWAKAVKDQGVLKVGGVKSSALFSLQSPDDNKVRGFDAGLSQLLARYILGDAKTSVSVVDSSTREAVLQNGTVNTVFATYSINPARQQKIDFAGPYLTSQQAILVKSTNKTVNSVSDLAGKKVGVQAGSTGPSIVKKFAPKANAQEFQTDAELVQALKQGRIDAYVVDESLVLGDIAKEPQALKLAGKPFGDKDEYGIGLPKGSDGTAFVNAWLQKIEADGTWAKLWKLTVGERTGVTKVPTPPAITKE